MDHMTAYHVREVRIDNQARLGDLYWNGTALFLLVKIRGKIYPISVEQLIQELTRDLPFGISASI